MAVIYAIQIVGPRHPIKIGKAKNLVTRFDSYRSHCPYSFRLLGFSDPVSDPYLVERQIRADLDAHRLRGREWYYPAAEVVAYLSRFLKYDAAAMPAIWSGREFEPRHLRVVTTGIAA